MNIDPAFPLIERYLDGISTDKEAAALAEAVEADPDVLAELCEAAGIEASLAGYLATPEQRRAMTPRILPLWHWRRAGKWMASFAAAAALVVSAGITFWPSKPGGPGGHAPGLASGMTVRRLTGDSHGKIAPAAAPAPIESAGPMEEVEFPVSSEWVFAMADARSVRKPGNEFASVIDIPVEGASGKMFDFRTRFNGMLPEDQARTDDYLAWYLRACGVTFPQGASAHWLQDHSGFVAVNVSENIERITRIQQDPVGTRAMQVIVFPEIWSFPEGTVPLLLQTERILKMGEFETLFESVSPNGPGARNLPQAIQMAPSETQCRFLLHGKSGAGNSAGGTPPVEWGKIHAHLLLNQWRVGDHIVISGLAGPRPGDVPLRSPPEVQNAELEFVLTLASREAAVLHLGRKADGTDWILVLHATFGDPRWGTGSSPTFTLGSIPNIMQFDEKLLSVKAGAPVRLLHRNLACALMHNFVLVKPGTAAAVGALADQMLRDPAALAKLYIPSSPDILVTGTRLLARGESELIRFIAPAEPGDYPYLCTFPGHWRLQQGILRVER